MNLQNYIAPISKAVAGAVISALVALAARYGFHASQEVIDASGVIITAVVSAVAGFVVVYISPKNKGTL